MTNPTSASLLGKRRLRSWQKFQTWIDDHSDSTWVFRGLGDIDFQLRPSIGRIANYSLAREQSVLASFRRAVPQYQSDIGFGEWEYLALAQHHGVPTRLLDWTTNPLVAAYFAVSALPASIEMRHKRRTIKAIPDFTTVDCRLVATRVRRAMVLDTAIVPDPFAQSEIAFVLPRTISSRIGSQSGLFTIHPKPDESWSEPLRETDDVFPIAGESREFFLRRLFYLGVDPLYLMGGLDGLGARASWQASKGVRVGAIT